MKMRIFAVLLILLLLTVTFAACINTDDYTQIKLGDLVNADGTDVSDTLKALEGKKVFLKAYMHPQSPLKGDVVYLVAQPAATCPFCFAKYADAMAAVYRNNKAIVLTRQLVVIYGELQISDVLQTDGNTTPFRILIDKIDHNA
jgi:hypothetical protein